MIRPSGETNEPEPCGKRIDDFCTWSSHLSEISKLYLSLRYLAGGLVNSHMPSSARAAGARSSAASSAPQVRRVIVSPLLEPIFPRWTPSESSDSAPVVEVTCTKDHLQPFPRRDGLQAALGGFLKPLHQALFLHGCPEIGPPGTPRTHGDDVRTRLSGAANLTRRRKPAVAGRFGPE